MIALDGSGGVGDFAARAGDFNQPVVKSGGERMQTWEYKVAYVDFRGRVSIEGEEVILEAGERRSEFVRRVLNRLGAEGWELAGVHPLWPAETSYMVFKRPAPEQ